MALVGFNDLQARSAYQPIIHNQGDRWIAYIGHHGGMALNPLTGKQENNGTSIVDVTDPKQPKYLAHIPGAARAGRGRRRADGAGVRRQRNCRAPTRARFTCCAPLGNTGHEIWDVTDPAQARPPDGGRQRTARHA